MGISVFILEELYKKSQLIQVRMTLIMIHSHVRLLRTRDGDGRFLGWTAAHQVELSDHRGRYIVAPVVNDATRYELPDGTILLAAPTTR